MALIELIDFDARVGDPGMLPPHDHGVPDPVYPVDYEPRERLGEQECVFNEELIIWTPVKRPWVPAERPRHRGAGDVARPKNLGAGQKWDEFCQVTGVRMWVIQSLTMGLVLAEVRRLGYAATAVYVKPASA